MLLNYWNNLGTMSNLLHITSIILLLAVLPSCYSKQKAFTFYNLMKRPQGYRRIFGGTAPEFEESPFIVAILAIDQTPTCTAIAVTSRWCITAAHCFLDKTDAGYQFVRYNSEWAQEGGNLTLIEKSYWHPRFQYAKQSGSLQDTILVVQNDIGMVYTEDEMIIDTSKPFPVFAEYEEPTPKLYDRLRNQQAEVYGYGHTEDPEGHHLSTFTVKLDLTTYSVVYQECMSGYANGSAICEGDSGGPVFVDDVLVGITCLSQVECTGYENEEGESIVTLIHPYADRITGMIDNITSVFPWLSEIPEGGAGASSLMPDAFAIFLIIFVLLLSN